MSTDRELLELAAKAIGCLVTGWNTAQSEVVAVLDDGSFWQPLHKNRITDCDGDALRLAVKLGICFGPNLDGDMAVCFGIDGHNVTEPHGSDPCSSTRRAIVRAAAAIGRAMP